MSRTFYTPRIFSLYIRPNERIGRLQFLGFNFSVSIVFSLFLGPLYFWLLKKYPQDPMMILLIMDISMIPFHYYFYRTVVLRLRDIFFNARHVNIIWFSILWYITVKGLEWGAYLLADFSPKDSFNILDIAYFLLVAPLFIVLFFVGGKSKQNNI